MIWQDPEFLQAMQDRTMVAVLLSDLPGTYQLIESQTSPYTLQSAVLGGLTGQLPETLMTISPNWCKDQRPIQPQKSDIVAQFHTIQSHVLELIPGADSKEDPLYAKLRGLNLMQLRDALHGTLAQSGISVGVGPWCNPAEYIEQTAKYLTNLPERLGWSWNVESLDDACRDRWVTHALDPAHISGWLGEDWDRLGWQFQIVQRFFDVANKNPTSVLAFEMQTRLLQVAHLLIGQDRGAQLQGAIDALPPTPSPTE